MSQRGLAEQAGIRQALISEIERGEANVTIDSLLRIAIALQVSLPGLLDGSSNQAQVRRRDD
jgi:DNA adenine methylase